MSSLADLVSGHSNFTAFLNETDLRHLLLIYYRHEPIANHLRRCLDLVRAVVGLARGLYGGLDPDRIVAIVHDQIAARLDAASRPVLRAQLGQLAAHQRRCLVANLCQGANPGAGEHALTLVADTAADQSWVRIAFGAGVRLERAWVTAWARSRLGTRRTGPRPAPQSALPISLRLDFTDDDDRIREALRAVPLNPDWDGDQIRALVDAGYDPARTSTGAALSALRPEALRALLDCQLTPSLLLIPDANGDKMTAIARAVEAADLVALRIMVEFLARFDRIRVGIPVVLAAEIRSMTPLTLAAYRGYTDAVRILLEFIPESERARALARPDFRGRTAIHWAAYNCHEGALRALLQGCSQRQDRIDLVSAVDSILGGNRPDQYSHIPHNIRRIFEELQADSDSIHVSLTH